MSMFLKVDSVGAEQISSGRLFQATGQPQKMLRVNDVDLCVQLRAEGVGAGTSGSLPHVKWQSTPTSTFTTFIPPLPFRTSPLVSSLFTR